MKDKKQNELEERPAVLDDLPEPVAYTERMIQDLEPPAELIEGMLRANQKMLLTGPERAEKSRLLKELAISLALGTEWLCFRCRKCRVFYVDLAYDGSRTMHHFMEAFAGHYLNSSAAGGLMLWSVKGLDMTPEQLENALLKMLKEKPADVIILDPLWRLFNYYRCNAAEEAAFCRVLDRICEESGAAVIYSMDDPHGFSLRTGVQEMVEEFGYLGIDANAFLHLRRVGNTRDADSAWRLEGTFKDYPPLHPVRLWYRFPVHHLYVSRSG